MKIALTMLCERPDRRTGLTTFFNEFITHSLAQDRGLEWIVFADPNTECSFPKDRVRIIRWFSGKRLWFRLVADHLLVAPMARFLGASALVTVGFVPLIKAIPAAMHLLVFATADHARSLRTRYRDWMARHGLRTADLIITNSNWAASQILARDAECQDRLLVSYEGLKHELFHSHPGAGEVERLDARFGLSPGYLLWVSNFYSYKQPEALIKAYARLDKGRRRRAPLVMVGGSWGRAEAVLEVARDLGVSEDVRLLDWVDDEFLPTLYRHAGAFCAASREETFGRSVVEAMACGAVCVVNDIPVMREVTAGQALLVDFRDAAAAAEALAAALFDEGTRERVRGPAMKRAREFSFDGLAAERMAAITTMLSRQTRENPAK